MFDFVPYQFSNPAILEISTDFSLVIWYNKNQFLIGVKKIKNKHDSVQPNHKLLMNDLNTARRWNKSQTYKKKGCKLYQDQNGNHWRCVSDCAPFSHRLTQTHIGITTAAKLANLPWKIPLTDRCDHSKKIWQATTGEDVSEVLGGLRSFLGQWWMKRNRD